MIKFFRKIRRQLLSQNRFSKYLLYAVGEIVLVVIGILIALQINNWNQSRLDHIEGRNYLLRIDEDLKKDTTFLTTEIKASKRESDSLTLFLKLIHKKQDSHIDFIRLLSLTNWNPRNVLIQDNTFLEMNSSGKFDLIKSVELKKEILEYYAFRDYVFNHIEVTTKHGFDLVVKILPNLSRYYSYEELKEFDIFRKSDWNWINDSYDPKFKTLEASASHFRFKAYLITGYYQHLHEKAINIQMLISDSISN